MPEQKENLAAVNPAVSEDGVVADVADTVLGADMASLSIAELEHVLLDEKQSTSEVVTPSIMEGLSVSDIAELLQRLPRPQRLEFWLVVGVARRGEILLELGESVRTFLIENSDAKMLSQAASYLESDDLAVLIRLLPSELAEAVIAQLGSRERRKISRVLTYTPSQAGSLMNLDFLRVGANDTVKTVIKSLRKNPELTSGNDVVFVVDEDNRLIGDMPIKYLLLNPSGQTMAEIMDTHLFSIRAGDSVDDAVRVIQDRDLIALAVVNGENALLGQITVDDIVDVVSHKGSKDVASSVSNLTPDEDLFAPVWQSTTKRALWLGINLLTAFLASAVVSQFGGTIEQAVGLAVLMPIVASMGGIAGSQTMVLVIRGIALNFISRENMPRLAIKELLVGITNGVIWAVIIAALVYFWMGEWWLTAIIMLALFINILVGTFSGVLLPFLLRLFGSDPAISAHVILTTVTDVIGLGVFLGAASWYLGSL